MTDASAAVPSDQTKKLFFISLTGMGVWPSYFPRFLWYTIPVVPQAQKSSGNILVKTNAKDGLQCTITVWESQKDMLNFLRSGAHAKAMRQFRLIASHGMTYGYDSDVVPDWDEAHTMLREKGKMHYDNRAKNGASHKPPLLTLGPPMVVLSAAVIVVASAGYLILRK